MADVEIHPGPSIAVASILIPMNLGLVATRIYGRRRQGNGFGVDDWTCIAALVLLIGLCITVLVETAQHHLSYPESVNIFQSTSPNSNAAWWPVVLLDVPALGLTKASFIWFYRRIFAPSRQFNHVTWFVLGIVAAWTISMFFSFLFSCGTRFDDFWFGRIREDRTCIDTQDLHTAFIISDFLLDLVIILLPIPMIWRLHLSMQSKLAVSSIFLVGVLTIMASCVRMVIGLQIIQADYITHAVDMEFLITSAAFWSMLEAGLGVTTACLPFVYYLLREKQRQNRQMRGNYPLNSIEHLSGSGARHRKMAFRHTSEVDDEIDLVPYSRTHPGVDTMICTNPQSSEPSVLAGGQILVTHHFEQVTRSATDN